MNEQPESATIEANKRIIRDMVDTVKKTPRCNANVRRLDISHDEAEVFDDERSYEEQYDEDLPLRDTFMVAGLGEADQLLGIGVAVILGLKKRALLRTHRVRRCGLVLPMLPYQDSIQQPRDYITNFEALQETFRRYARSCQKQTLRCWPRSFEALMDQEREAQ